jgi:hypothetical protein
MDYFSSVFCLYSPRQKGNIPLVYLANSFVQRRCNQFPSCVSSLPNSVLCLPGGLADSLGCKQISFMAVQINSRQRFLCLLVFGRSWSSQMLVASLFLRFSGLCYCWQACRRDLCRRVAVVGSMSAYIMAGPGTPRCLQVRRELREKKKRKSSRLAGAVWPCFQLFPKGRQTGGPTAAPWPCTLDCYAL